MSAYEESYFFLLLRGHLNSIDSKEASSQMCEHGQAEKARVTTQGDLEM